MAQGMSKPCKRRAPPLPKPTCLLCDPDFSGLCGATEHAQPYTLVRQVHRLFADCAHAEKRLSWGITRLG